MSELPPGFVLDGPAAPPTGLPDGFVLDGAPAPAPEAPPKFTLADTWPARVAKSLYGAVTLPRDVLTGQVPMRVDGQINPEVIGRSADTALFFNPLPVPLRAGEGVAGAVRAAAPVGQAATAAQNVGVALPKAIATDSPTHTFVGQVSAKMPGGGPLFERTKEALGQTGQAVERASALAGGTADPLAAGQGFQTAIKESFKPAMKARVSEAYGAVEKLVKPDVTTPLSSTQAVAADIMARRIASGDETGGRAVQNVVGGITRPGGLTFKGLQDLRTRIGEMLDMGMFPEGVSQAELRRIYGGLSDDLFASARNAGGEGAVKALEVANRYNALVERQKANISKLLGADRSGEAITEAIIRVAKKGPSGDVTTLAQARAAVPKDVWRDVASTTIARLGRDRKGEFSPNIFLNDYAALSPKGKEYLFRDVGAGNVTAYLDDIARVSQKFVEAGKLGNPSGTAGHAALWTSIGGGVVGTLHGSLVEPLSALGLVVGNNVLARWLSRPASAASIARWARAYDAFAKRATSSSLASLSVASRNLSTLAQSEGLTVRPNDFLQSVQPRAAQE